MSTIFISHSSKDAESANELKVWLENQGHSAFLDSDLKSGIKGGEKWEKTLYHHLRRCRVVIPILSHHSLESKWCLAEVVLARYKGKTIIPLKIDTCDPEKLYSPIQLIDLTVNSEEGYQRLEHSLKEVFPWNETLPPYPGLTAFQENQAGIFFGRDQEISQGIEVLESLRRQRPGAPRGNETETRYDSL